MTWNDPSPPHKNNILASLKEGMGHAKPSGSSIHHFVSFDIERICFLIGHCPHGHPNNNMQVLTRGLFFFLYHTLHLFRSSTQQENTLAVVEKRE